MVKRLAGYLLAAARLEFVGPGWRIPCFTALGVLGGLGLAVGHVSRAASYMGDSPETCTNCHIMGPEYLTWQHSAHGRVATCNDCHVPHDNPIHHYSFKARDGMRHSAIFTLRWEPQAIRLSAGAVPVVEANCRRCHSQLIDAVHLREYEPGDPRCWDCHRQTPHGLVRSLSATPPVMRPALPQPLESLKELSIGGRTARPDKESLHGQ